MDGDLWECREGVKNANNVARERGPLRVGLLVGGIGISGLATTRVRHDRLIFEARPDSDLRLLTFWAT